jgi:hypothetical protein
LTELEGELPAPLVGGFKVRSKLPQFGFLASMSAELCQCQIKRSPPLRI